ncbi:GNAT family N-acetyltransferase [Sedimentibacter sp. zth1]|uniref:GNAT family N-acetyltransferase n=1 Tax=Sedimentibacter sp. zth1 TaxID=2816908 RepID=UPI001A9155CF|nr:GNAT family N-acetyltransferase [Sedimentibacter sp. zth1]QSX05926.1 GNAT family N-acetyltransferase [Sedimentibacter sp. zth1]
MEDIVRLTLKDLDDIYKFDIICFPNDYTKREYWIELLEDERTFVFAFKENNIIKANISIYNWKGENNYIKIMTIGTHPDYRNKGYAHMLMQYIIDEMLKDDMHIFKGETRESNLKMQKVFEDFGYKINKKVEEYYDNPTETAYKYSLEI